jgi:hypothetical protein
MTAEAELLDLEKRFWQAIKGKDGDTRPTTSRSWPTRSTRS